MSLKHLSQRDIFDYIEKNDHTKKENEIIKHLIICEECQKKVNDYRLMITEIRKIKTYEPNNNFVNIVTKNLPDKKYAKKEKPIVELFSLIMISIPFGIVIGFLFHSNQIKFTSLGKMFGLFSSLIHFLYNSLYSFPFVHENIDVFGMFIFYMLSFYILNRFFVQGKLKKKFT